MMISFRFRSRNGSGSSSGSREQSPTYQNWSQTSNKTKDSSDAKKTTNHSASDCTSSTECSEDSDRNSDNVYNVQKGGIQGGNAPNIPTPAPRTTLEKSTKSSLQSSIRSMSVDRVKQVRHESLV